MLTILKLILGLLCAIIGGNHLRGDKMKFIKPFYIFFYSFLALISLLVIPSLIAQKDYGKMIIFLLILAFLIIVSISIYVFFAKCALNFVISDDIITFQYTNNLLRIQITDIKNIVITQYRYILILQNGKKLFVSKVNGPFKIKKVDNRILELSKTYDIKIDGAS